MGDRDTLLTDRSSLVARHTSGVTRHAARLFVAGVNGAVALAVVAFWTAWHFAPEAVQSVPPGAPGREAYLAHEEAFPLADGWMAACALLGALGLVHRRPWGAYLCLLANGAMLFLALLDLLFALQRGAFWPPGAETAQTWLIVAGLVFAATVSAATIYRRRLAGPAS
ncbi:MAG: hypothetical protein HPY83_02570 [Anaerolineae bacterium]|nr:hypothetical protein [Anaerolineae bacterium]